MSAGTRRLPWIITGAAVLALLLLLSFPRRGDASLHPTPRPGITAEKVLPPIAVPRVPGAPEAYAVARRIPGVLDGLYCHCDCSKHMGHRSLLTCYETEHAAQCDICQGEAMMADRMAAAGSSLDAIRQAIDAQWGNPSGS